MEVPTYVLNSKCNPIILIDRKAKKENGRNL